MRRTAAILAAALLLRGGRGINYEDTVESYCGYYDIEVEQHTVLTDDGYMLVLHRLPRRGAPVAMLYHGNMGSSWIWLSNRPQLSPALELYRGGYDVWLPNSRGNIYSLHHKTLNSSRDTEFWNFTLTDFARYDMPATIDHALAVSGRQSLSLIAHSEAAFAFFLANGMEPSAQRLASKVNLFIALGPIAYLSHQRSPLFTAIYEAGIVALAAQSFPLGVPNAAHFEDFIQKICDLGGISKCKKLFGWCGGQSDLDKPEAVMNHSAHFPAGTSMKNVLYYVQLSHNRIVSEFDYGTAGNMARYGRRDPPLLSLGGLSIPTAMFFGGNDYYSSPVDADHLRSDFSRGNVIHSAEYPGFSHMTWVTGGLEAFKQWWPRVRKFMQMYNPVYGFIKPFPETFLARA